MKHRFQINLRGIIDLLSNHLYSRPEVFVRELLQNGVDAITARRQLEPGHAGEITLDGDAAARKPPTLEVTDNGIGLTEDEIHRFLATIGETSKRDADGRRTGDFIGQFGIGLLSCFVVSDEIVVVTARPRATALAVEWRGRPDGTYPCACSTPTWPRARRSTSLSRGQGGDLPAAIPSRSLARHYGGLLPYPDPRDDRPGERRRQRRTARLGGATIRASRPGRSRCCAMAKRGLRHRASSTRFRCVRGPATWTASPSCCRMPRT